MPFEQSNSIRRPFELEYGHKESAVFNFFNVVYAWMCVGLAVTAASALLVSRSLAAVQIMNSTSVIMIFFLAAFLIPWLVQKTALQMSAAAATVVFLVYAAFLGAVLSGIFLVYSLPSIGGAFFLTAGIFGAMSVYGFVTKKDLTSMGSFLTMAIVGLFIATIVNFFIASGPFSWLLTYLILGVFIVFTVYETQQLKQFAIKNQDNADLAGRMAIVGALILYIAFLNMFLSVLRIFGGNRG